MDPFSTQKNCKETKQLLSNFFNQTDVSEVGENLARLLDVYIQHTEDDRITMANSATMVNKIMTLIYKLEKVQTREETPQIIKPGIPTAIEN